jgi:osmotically-inducible protein OsmY
VRDRSEGGNITVFCRDGQIVLAGEVEELPAKMVSERLAKSIDGVRFVVNNLKLKAIPSRTDAEIHDHLVDAYEQDRSLDERMIQPIVQDGVVTLTGTVDALAKKRLAGLFAWWQVGVKDVKNHLVIAPDEEDNDDEIRDFLCIAFELDKAIERDRVGVKVKDGVVTLYGVARSTQEAKFAEADAWATFGVKDVVNNLTVK